MRKKNQKNSSLDWQPELENAVSSPASGQASATDHSHHANDTWTGLIHPKAMVGFIIRRFFSIVIVAALVVAAGLALYTVLPASYGSKALILVDPRQPRITENEEVLSGIGGDAAALASYVEIMNSDGFLSKVVDELGVKDDPDFDKATNKVELINAFRKNLAANRQGATYLVEVYYKSSTGEKAAKYANGVADAFVRDQRNLRDNASSTATKWLSDRLQNLRANLKRSEDAVAAYQAKNGIVDTGSQGTLDNQQLTSLVNQLATATTELAEAKARYDQARRDGVPASSSTTQTGQFANLDQLLQEQDRLRRQSAELNQTLGSRHPQILANGQQQKIIAGQIAKERGRLVRRTEQAYATAKAKKVSLERQLADSRKRALQLNKATVQLANLQREANANRNLYEQFLARYKATDEQSQLQTNEARIASAATIPTKSTKPSLKLVLPVLVILGGALGLLVALIREAFASPHPSDRANAAAKPARKEQEPAVSHMDRPVEHFLERKQPKVQEQQAPQEASPAVMQNEEAPQGISVDDLAEVAVSKVASEAVADTQSSTQRKRSAADGDWRAQLERQSQTSQAALGDERDDPANLYRLNGRDDDSDLQDQPVDQNADKENGTIILSFKQADFDQDGEPDWDRLLNRQGDRLEAFLTEDHDSDKVSIFVTPAQVEGGQEVTTELLREFAIDAGYRPMIISLRHSGGQSLRNGQGRARAARRAPAVQEFEEFDVIPFVAPARAGQGRTVSVRVADEIANLVELCKQSNGFVILEAQNILDPASLEDLVSLCDASLLVLEQGQLRQNETEDWKLWAKESGVGLVLDQADA